jgi:integrase
MINNSLSRAVSRFCERMKFRKFTPRDIRRTWKSRAGEIGISKADRDKVQAHAIGSDVSSKHYDRYDYMTEKTAAMNAWCEFLQALVTNANVTPIRPKTTVITE